MKNIFKRIYYIHYFSPKPNHYAYHVTNSWLLAHWYLWIIKRNGYKKAYIEKSYE